MNAKEFAEKHAGKVGAWKGLAVIVIGHHDEYLVVTGAGMRGPALTDAKILVPGRHPDTGYVYPESVLVVDEPKPAQYAYWKKHESEPFAGIEDQAERRFTELTKASNEFLAHALTLAAYLRGEKVMSQQHAEAVRRFQAVIKKAGR